jgi:hypothetical protein
VAGTPNFCRVTSGFPANYARRVPQIEPRPLYATSVLVNYSVTTLPFEATGKIIGKVFLKICQEIKTYTFFPYNKTNQMH